MNGYGQVKVSVKKEEDSVVIRVVNTGSSLTQEQMQALRQSVFQKKSEKGKGVGLQNVYNRVFLYYKDKAEMIMEVHDGEACFGFKIYLGRLSEN